MTMARSRSILRSRRASSLTRNPLLVAGLFVVSVLPAFGHDVEPLPPDYVHSFWTTRHGLPQNFVRPLAQTRDGYLWAGTGSGLARFDGVRFVVFDMATTPELPSNWISALYEDAAGALWIGTDRGLVRYSNGQFTRQDVEEANRRAYIQAIQQDRQGRIWVATDSQVLRLRGDRWRAIQLGAAEIRGLLVDGEGTLWIGTERGLVEWRERRLRTFTVADGLPAGPLTPLIEDRAGGLWVRGDRGLARLDRMTGRARPAPGELAGDVVYGASEGRDGRLWIGARDALYALDGADRPAIIYPVNAAGQQDVLAVLEDRQGHLWFSVSGGRGGLHRLSPQRATVLAHEQGLPCDNATSVTQGPDGTVWAGLLCRRGAPSLVAIRDGRIIPNGGAVGAAPSHVAALLALPEGELWIGTFGPELFHLADGRFTRYSRDNGGFTGKRVLALHRDADGVLWIGAETGLHRFHQGRWTRFTARDGLVDDDVRHITSDSEGALWIGTSGGLSRYVAGRFTIWTRAQGLPPGAVRAIHIEKGTVWIGTYGGGLARLEDGVVTPLGSQGGLLDSSVHRILTDDRGHFWLSGDRGIRRVRRDELAAVADGRSTRLSVDLFDERDGLKNAEANGMAQPAGWRMRDGSLWFPTQGGLVRIDPEAAAHDTPPLPVIETVIADGTAYDPREAIRVPPGARELEIHYTAPAFTRPEQTRFRYRLAGHDPDWVQAGTRRVAHYANLSPGSYRFEVIARSAAGIWSEERATLPLTLEPRFYQGPIARLGALLLLVAAIHAAVRLRLVRLRRRAAALETTVAERTAELSQKQERLELANRQLGEANRREHQANDVLQASLAKMLSVLAQLRIGVLVVDEQERVLFASEATDRLLGNGAGEAVGRALEEVLPIPAATLAEVREQLSTPRSGVRTAALLEPRSAQHYWTEIEVGTDPRDPRQRILYLYDVTEAYDFGRSRTKSGDGAIARLLGVSPAIQLVRAHVLTVAGVDATVLIEGETGTGKELVAHAIHEESPRCKRPFVAINCAGLTESLLASQLFGHKRGAFTGAVSDHVGLFEAAQGGTLLLDEIGDMPLSMQTHLLRVLQEREIIRVGDTRPRPIDVRLLAATHQDLERDVKEGRFREDLLYRIRVARIPLPPLRQRPEDIPPLAGAFLAGFAAEYGKTLDDIGCEAMERLARHTWPGNVRELKSVIEWAVIHATGPVIKLGDLPPDLATDGVPPPQPPHVPEAERQVLIEALKRTGGNRTAAARLLGIGRSTFYRRLAALEKGAAEALEDQRVD